MMESINMNDAVVVELTKKGAEILEEYYIGKHTKSDYHLIFKNNYKFQMWELIEIFGKYCFQGMSPIFKNNEIKKYNNKNKGGK